MARSSSIYVCQQCDYQSPTFLGRCPECGSWSSLVEQITSSQGAKSKPQSLGSSQVVDLAHLDQQKYQRLSSKLDEFDRSLGGGIVVGSVILISGDPGIGKST